MVLLAYETTYVPQGTLTFMTSSHERIKSDLPSYKDQMQNRQ